jgi:hypothetical protein
MGIISLVEDREVIQAIRKHLGRGNIAWSRMSMKR